MNKLKNKAQYSRNIKVRRTNKIKNKKRLIVALYA